MSHPAHPLPKIKLNAGLDVDDFEICVPQKSRLLGIDFEKDWEDYKRQLRSCLETVELPLPPPPDPECATCYSCECGGGEDGLGWVLRGEMALEHARRVHAVVHRQILSLEHVSAVDVGFAIAEDTGEFLNLLALRVHVNQKMPPEQLERVGIVNLTNPEHVARFWRFDGRINAAEDLSDPDRTNLIELVKEGRSRGDVAECLSRFEILSEDWLEANAEPLREVFEESLNAKELEHLKNGGSQFARLWKVEDRCSSCDLLRREQLKRLLQASGRLSTVPLPFPIGAVQREDLSLRCPENLEQLTSLRQVRVCISGVPLDIINARYTLSVRHPGGDAARGVFAEAPKISQELSHEEIKLTGRGRVNPLVGGISVGTVGAQAGTLGTIVWDKTDATPCILSNWHVLAGSPTAQVGQDIYQPALFDGGSDTDVVAHLKRWRLSEQGDAAIAELSGNRHYAAGEILGLWNAMSDYMAPKLNLEVRKVGRTTVFTEGFIDGIDLATNIDYTENVFRYFKNQFHIAPLYRGQSVSQVGDSGSVVFTRFRPAQSELEVELLLRWLRDACLPDGSKGLRDQIEKELSEWLSGLTGSADLEKVFKDILAEVKGIPKDDLEDLRKALKKTITIGPPKGDLRKIYERLVEGTVQLEAGKTKLETLHQCCSEASCHPYYACAQAQALVAELNKVGSDDTCPPIKPCSVWSSPAANCDKVNSALICIDKKLGTTLQVRQIAAEAIETLSAHAQQAGDILAATDRSKELCKALRAAIQENSPSGDPSKIIRHVLASQNKTGATFQPASVAAPAEGGGNAPAPANDVVTKLEEALKDPQTQDRFNKVIGKALSGGLLKKTLKQDLADHEVLSGLIGNVEAYQERIERAKVRRKKRANYAVGLIFAGDTPGSPFGEFAIASDLEILANELRFSLRPVFEPRSSFRELRERPDFGRSRAGGGGSLAPGEGRADPEGGRPQPQTKSIQQGPRNSGGGQG